MRFPCLNYVSSDGTAVVVVAAAAAAAAVAATALASAINGRKDR